MTPKDKKKAFDAAVKAGVKNRTLIQIDTASEIVRLLEEAQRQIAITIAGQPSDYQLWSLSNLQFEITRMMKDFSEASGAIIGTGAGVSWQAGQELTDKALMAAGEASIVSIFPRLDTAQLTAMRTFMTDRIKDIGVQGANKINSELGLVVIGAQSPGDAITRVRDILGDPSRKRAHTIVRTELGRVFSVASNQRMKQAKEAGVPLNKKWIKSGKQHPRLGHNLAHGQTVPVDQPFLIPSSTGGSATRMMHPHDPAAPAKETINCGCTAIPSIDFSQPITPSGFISGIRRTIK